MQIMPRVIDLSHYNDVQDKFSGAVKFGIWGVINKVSEGVGNRDHSFDWRRKPAADAGLLYGGYHFIRPGRIAEQADWFLKCVGDPKGLRLVLDHETKGVSLADVRGWLERVHAATGQWSWLYSYSSFIIDQFAKEGGAKDPFWQKLKFWGAAYNSKPRWPAVFPNPILWQYTGDGSWLPPHNVPGIVIDGKGIDINHFAGTREELSAAWSL